MLVQAMLTFPEFQMKLACHIWAEEYGLKKSLNTDFIVKHVL